MAPMVEAATTRRRELEEALDGALRNRIDRYEPQCVILFGGLARGECHEWSDIDLCIIKETDRPFLQRMVEARRLADTPAEWREMVRSGNYFIRDEILGAGRVLHGRPD